MVMAKLWRTTINEAKQMLVDSGELAYWIAEYELNPWGDYREDNRQAVIGSYIGAVWGGKAKPSDLIPQYDRHDVKDENKLGWIQFRAYCEAHNQRQKKES